MEMKWNKIETRPMTEEEIEEYADWNLSDDEKIMYTNIPIDFGEYIVSTISGYVTVDKFHPDPDGAYFDSYELDEIIAWMPLPEPYKETNDEK